MSQSSSEPMPSHGDPSRKLAGQDSVIPAARPQRRRRRRDLTASDLEISEALPPNLSHPLASLSEAQRDHARIADLGMVLAAIAKRGPTPGNPTVKENQNEEDERDDVFTRT